MAGLNPNAPAFTILGKESTISTPNTIFMKESDVLIATLKAKNDELQAKNDELQAKNAELLKDFDDMRNALVFNKFKDAEKYKKLTSVVEDLISLNNSTDEKYRTVLRALKDNINGKNFDNPTYEDRLNQIISDTITRYEEMLKKKQ